MHTFHGSFIRKCIVTHVIDGKTIRVLLNPEGGQQRTQSGLRLDGLSRRGFSYREPLPSEELDASPLDPKTWEKVDVRLIYVDTEEALLPKKEEAAYKVREFALVDDEETRNERLTRKLALVVDDSQPVTPSGQESFDWLKKRLGAARDGRCGNVEIDLEFDTCAFMSISARECSMDKYGRMLAYAHLEGSNVNIDLVRAGQSVYFTKYGRSRLYHGEFQASEKAAMEDLRGIWDPTATPMMMFGLLEYSRDYRRLLPWWKEREMFMEDWRHWNHLGIATDVLNPRDYKDYQTLARAAAAQEKVTVLVDLQPTQSNLYDGVMQLVKYENGMQGMCIFAGTRQCPFNLWMDDATTAESARLQNLLHSRYCQRKCNYCFITGKLFIFHAKQRPQLLLESCDQISDFRSSRETCRANAKAPSTDEADSERRRVSASFAHSRP